MTNYPMPRFPPPEINKNRPTLHPVQANFISGDSAGLYRLASDIYDYVSQQSAPVVETLVKEVTVLVKDDKEPGGYTPGPNGGWVGDTANTFLRTFISDAAMMNGLNSVVCEIAKTVDTLAGRLSALEYALEMVLERALSRMCDGFSVNWLVTSGSGTEPRFELTPLGAASVKDPTVLDVCARLSRPFFAKAERLRHTAGSELAGHGKILTEAFTYYAGYSAGPGSPSTMDPSILLTSGQARADYKGVNALTTDYAKLTAQLNKSGLDQAAIKNTLTNLGVNASNVGDLIDTIKDAKKAEGTVAAGSKFLSPVGKAVPVLMTIGMAAA